MAYETDPKGFTLLKAFFFYRISPEKSTEGR